MPVPSQPGFDTTNFVVDTVSHHYEPRSGMNATARSERTTVWVRRLKEARHAAGLSQRQLGVAAGLDEGVASARINRYEVGVHRPDYGIAVKLARALDVPVAFLYCDDDLMAQVLMALHHAPVSLQQQVLGLLQKATG